MRTKNGVFPVIIERQKSEMTASWQAGKLAAALSPFLIDYIDKYPTSVLADNR